jgi:UDP-glucose 4-epimerase
MKLKEKTILVTGGAGFIGSHLVERLVQENPKKIIVVDNLHLGKQSNLSKAKSEFTSLDFYKLDVSLYEEIYKIFDKEKIDMVFSLAVTPLPECLEKPQETFLKNIQMVSSLCELQRRNKFSTLIHFSSSETYGTAIYKPMDEDHPLMGTTTYAASKSACDLLIFSYYKMFGIDYSIIRPFNNYGPRQNYGLYSAIIPSMLKKIYNNEPLEIYGNGTQTRDFIYVNDTVEASVLISKNEKTRSKVINVGSGKEIQIKFLVNMLCDLTSYDKKNIKYVGKRVADVNSHISDISLCKETIGFEPKISLQEGIEKTINWYFDEFKNRNFN